MGTQTTRTSGAHTDGQPEARLDVGVTVNGAPKAVSVRPAESAADALRERLDLTGTKVVCGGGVCGACTALVDGRPTATCLLPATALDGAEVTTIEGVGEPERHLVQRAFAAHDALQCGYCTPGFVVGAVAFVDRWREERGDIEPDRPTIADALAGHLCRCGTYEGIYRAVAAACRGDFDKAGPATGQRVEAEAKVTGAARYTTDVSLPGMLHGVIVRSRHGAGTVAELDLTHAMNAGAHDAIVLLDEDRTVRWVGQPLAAVVASDRHTAELAAEAVHPVVEPQSPVLDHTAAVRAGARAVYADRSARRRAPSSAEGMVIPAPWRGNLRGPNVLTWLGPVAAQRIGRADARDDPRLVRLDVETAVQMHTSFEPHACVADFSDPAHLRLWVSTQAAGSLVTEVAQRFGLRLEQVTVHAEHVGGGFGSKGSLTMETVAAVGLSRATRRPVKVVLDRREELTATGNRPGTRTSVALLADSGGDLAAVTIDTHGLGGVSVGSAVAALGALVYGRSPRRARDYDIVTNAPPGTPFRGPGGPPVLFALESAVDEMARRLGEDPISLRRRWDGNERRRRLYDRAASLPLWTERASTVAQGGRIRTGVGVAAANWFYFVDPDTRVSVSVRDGRLSVASATQDMGTGSRTVLANAVAQVFEVDPHEVQVRIGTTGSAPHGPTSAGSRTTTSLWAPAVEAAEQLKRSLAGQPVADSPDREFTATRAADRRRRPLPLTVAGIQAGRQFTGAVHVAEVEVDTVLGHTRVTRVWGGINVGKIHAPQPARSQAEGSIIQGVGFALYEEQRLDPHTGATLSSNLEDYRIPALGDTPEIDIHFDEQGWEHVPGGGVGLGEVATLGTAAAIGNAIRHATGRRPRHLPMTPARMIELLR
ncbi:MAG: molybdopterin-dependent oxidoreductase [Ornithinimicrobium sp.]